MAQTYNLISTVSFIMSVVCLLVAIILFFKFNIRKIVGDLTGRNAKKSIEQMRHTSRKSVNSVIYENKTQQQEEKTQQIETQLLEEKDEETIILSDWQLISEAEKFIVTKDIVFIHANEVIE